MRILVDCDSFWDEYHLGPDETPPPNAITKVVTDAMGVDRTAVRFVRHTPSRTEIRLGDVLGSHADYVEGHRLRGAVPKHRNMTAFVADEHLAEVLSHHAHGITGVSVYWDGPRDTPDGQVQAQAAAELESYLRRKYDVGGIDEDKGHAHFVAAVPVLPNHEKRTHMQAHYASDPTQSVTVAVPDAVTPLSETQPPAKEV